MLIVLNWKAYIETKEKAKGLLTVAKRLSTIKRVKLVLAPSYLHLGLLAPGNRSKVSFAAQDVSAATAGAHTGEVTASSLKKLGVSYVIIGHSERRASGETDAVIVEKIKRTLAEGMTPIVCVGERERDEDAQYLRTLKQQISAVYTPLSPKERLAIVVAYEPVWAIGKTADDSMHEGDLVEMVLYIRKVLGEFLPGRGAEKVTVLYGGSVEPGNIRSLAGGSGVNGFLVGHASADRDMFTALVKALA